MTAHDPALLAKVAEAIAPLFGDGVVLDARSQQRRLARAVLDALDVPGLIRAAKAEALTEAADDMERIFRAGDLLGGPTDDWLRTRAAEIDPEEGDR